jgi:hypothetical protein
MPRRTAAVEFDYHCIPTPDVLWAQALQAGPTEATTSVSALAWSTWAFVIGRGRTHEVELSGLSRRVNAA